MSKVVEWDLESSGMQSNWQERVVADYRQRIFVDADSPLLAFKANRDRYTNLPSQKSHAGKPYLGSWNSEDALTWNVFRSLQKAGQLGILTNRLRIGDPQALLFWTLAPEPDAASAELQYVTGSIIRSFDGILRGQITEPDVVILATSGIALIECKLSEPGKSPSHLWEGELDSIRKRLPIYRSELPDLLSSIVRDEDVASVYQLVRLAFYAYKLGIAFGVEPVLVSLSNAKNWSVEVRKLHTCPSELWYQFCNSVLGKSRPRCESMFWQDLRAALKDGPLDALSAYLMNHPCL